MSERPTSSIKPLDAILDVLSPESPLKGKQRQKDQARKVKGFGVPERIRDTFFSCTRSFIFSYINLSDNARFFVHQSSFFNSTHRRPHRKLS
jgi:hypothetical protein